MRARGLGVGEYCEEERPCLQLRSSTGSSHLHHVSILRRPSIPQPIPHVEGHYARAEMILENPSTSYDAE